MRRKADKQREPLWRTLHKTLAPTLAAAGERLELTLPRNWPQQPGEIHWTLRARSGAAQRGIVTDLRELPQAVRAAPLHVWTPASETLLATASVPTRSRAKVLQALPYALEEQLLDPPEELLFAFEPEVGGSLAVAVTRRDRLRAWLATLAAAGLRPASLAPVALRLPLEPDAWTLAYTHDEIVMRGGPRAGFGAPPQLSPPAWLTAGLAEARQRQTLPVRLKVYNPPQGFDAAAWRAQLGVEVVSEASLPASDGPVLLNLLQGEYAPSGQWRELARPYLPAAVLLLLWLVGGFVADAGQWWSLWRAHRANENEMQALFTKSFPEIKSVVDPAQQMQRNLEVLLARSGTSLAHDLLPLLSRSAAAFRADQRVALQSLNYADRALVMTLVAPDGAAAETFRQALQLARLEVEQQSQTARGTAVELRLRVRPPQSHTARGGS